MAMVHFKDKTYESPEALASYLVQRAKKKAAAFAAARARESARRMAARSIRKLDDSPVEDGVFQIIRLNEEQVGIYEEVTLEEVEAEANSYDAGRDASFEEAGEALAAD